MNHAMDKRDGKQKKNNKSQGLPYLFYCIVRLSDKVTVEIKVNTTV